jgi:hypothetical protein
MAVEKIVQKLCGRVPACRYCVLDFQAANPKGIASYSPGLRVPVRKARATLGMSFDTTPTPTGLRHRAREATTPLGLRTIVPG